ncbi:Crp/Fnr family transcriptional regulator [Methylobacterium sp. WSM2598]|uniref:Crp/Fnr family transcriptional regulator n=1 Tax=Methylobacterium sp. WSM2598 TaxID=398261 RepID=UPI00037D35F5|nr:Crp/Fnr family transcriptional regulator [Methylobacterium sp. WSM2598]
MYDIESSPISALIRKLTVRTVLSREDQAALASLPVRVRRVGPGAEIVRAGDLPSSCCVVLDGWLCSYREGGSRRSVLSFHLPGDLCNACSLMLPLAEEAIGSVTEATLGFVPHDDLFAAMASSPRLTTALWRETLIPSRIRSALAHRSSHDRPSLAFAKLLCEFSLRLTMSHSDRSAMPAIPLAKAQFCCALGLDDVSFDSAIERLIADREIRVNNNELEVVDVRNLLRYVDDDFAYICAFRQAS